MSKSGDPKRAERLKAALRDNLKRRKAQMKARVKARGASPPPGGGRSPAERSEAWREGVTAQQDTPPRRTSSADPPPAGEGEEEKAR